MLTGRQFLHGAAVGYQMCVSASLIVPLNTHKQRLTSLPISYLQVLYETLKLGNASI